MTSKERFARVIAHKEADRIPIIDDIWRGTHVRWRREGMPDVDWRDFFGIDKCETIWVGGISPHFPEEIIEKNERYTIRTTDWGVTVKEFNEMDSTPQYLGFKIKTPGDWEEAKARMIFDEHHLRRNWLKNEVAKWMAEGRYVEFTPIFGFDITHNRVAGLEGMLIAMLEEPEWVADMFETMLNLNLRYLDAIWDEGYHFDAVKLYDDMGYKGTPFFSLETYRNLLKPSHRKMVQWAHDHGIPAHLHSCGNVMPLVADLVEVGFDILNPMEIKAGMDPLALKQRYAGKLALHGGMNAVLWEDKDAAVAEIERLVPTLKQGGGYIFSSDHSIHSGVSFETYRAIVEAAKRCGAY